MPSFMERARQAYEVLRGNDVFAIDNDSMITSYIPVTANYRSSSDTVASVLAPIQTRIAMDVAAVPFRHVSIDKNGLFVGLKESELNDRLAFMANIDQTGTAFIQDAAMTMQEDGSCVLIPTETTAHPSTGSYDILSIRVGTVTEWFNHSVRVNVYNELEGRRTEILVPKSFVAICYNPLYAVMNAPNSTVKRLIDKLALLDVADARLYSSQLDLILQLAYSVGSTRRRKEALRRLEDFESQLYERTYGVAYIDSTEKVTQLNRPVPNSLIQSIDSLSQSLYSQLGLTDQVFKGTASQEEMLAYNNKTIFPMIKALTEGMTSAFFSRTAIRQGNAIRAYQDLFKMAPLSEVAEAADKLTRNEIMSSNEVRSRIGLEVSDDPNADELRNKNLNRADQVLPGDMPEQQADQDEKE